MAWNELTLIGDESITFDRFKITQDVLEWDVQVDRPPFSDTWFKHGSEKQILGDLGIVVTPTFRDSIATMDLIDEIISNLPYIYSVDWNGKTRSVYGLKGSYGLVPAGFAYSLSFTLACEEGDWSAGDGSASSVSSILGITDGESSLSFRGDYPSEQMGFERTILNTKYGMMEVGDLRWNPSTLTLRAKVTDTNPDNAWKAMSNLVALAKDATSISIKGTDVEVFGLRRLERSYVGPTAIDLSLTFLPKGKILVRAYGRVQWITKSLPDAEFGQDYSATLEARANGSKTFSKLEGNSGISVASNGDITWNEVFDLQGYLKARVSADSEQVDKSFAIKVNGYPCMNSDASEVYCNGDGSEFYEMPVVLYAPLAEDYTVQINNLEFDDIRPPSYSKVSGESEITVLSSGLITWPTPLKFSTTVVIQATDGTRTRSRTFLIFTTESPYEIYTNSDASEVYMNADASEFYAKG